MNLFDILIFKKINFEFEQIKQLIFKNKVIKNGRHSSYNYGVISKKILE